MYLLDSWLEPVPVGVPGEIYVGGPGVAHGYLGRGRLTAERFVPDPFGAAPGQRLYRTGDLGRYRSDGAIEFLGRLDNQIKIRGYRVELGEIEASLEEHTGVADARVVVSGADADDRRLTAYYVPAGAAVSVPELRAYLDGRLPAYMVPANYVPLDRIPLTANGKFDQNALPEEFVVDDPIAPHATFEPPAPGDEELVAEACRGMLGVERIGRHDNLFDLGLHSLLALKIVFRLTEDLGVGLPLDAAFEAPTVAGLAARVRAHRADADATPARPRRADRTQYQVATSGDGVAR